MKRKKFETRGVTAAVIESRIAPTGDDALDAFLAKTEEAFFAAAEGYALAAKDEITKMSPRERRRAQQTKIALSSETDGEMRVTLTATLSSGAISREKKTSFFWDKTASLMSKKAKKRKKETSRKKL